MPLNPHQLTISTSERFKIIHAVHKNGDNNAARAGHGQYVKFEGEAYGRANGKHYCCERYVVPLTVVVFQLTRSPTTAVADAIRVGYASR